ncbi:MAG: NapC/NirT family cytochrome c [Myxococcales bacterium]|nr:NapC/NirT family cytochrome c [Myxococcales bacterium]
MHSPLSLVSLTSAAFAAGILLWFLFWRPPLDRTTKIALLFGLGVFPIGAAATSNIQGYEATTKREFCGSCHVMEPHRSDSNDLHSVGLASRHARNPYFGDKNCYVCHADYGMFGTVLTKAGGMRHVWLYYTEFRTMPLEEAKEKIHLRNPYSNENCMQCHSTKLQGWLATGEHRSALEDSRTGKVSCASVGCHGYAHPITKRDWDPAKVPAMLKPRDAGAPDAASPDAAPATGGADGGAR